MLSANPSFLLSFRRRSLLRRMQRTRNSHFVAGYVVDQEIVFVGDKFSGVLQVLKAADLGLIGQTFGIF